MDKCLSATGDLEQRQDFVKGFTLVKNKFVAERLTVVSIIEKDMVKARLEYAENCRVRCNDPYGDFYKKTDYFMERCIETLDRYIDVFVDFSLMIDDLDKYMKSLES